MFSDTYIKQLKQLHQDPSRKRGFGGKVKDLGQFYNFMNVWKPSTLLDYGCGKGVILDDIKEKYPSVSSLGYDPAVDEYSSMPLDTFDCVFSNDVLEHIEPTYLNDVLKHINSLASRFIWLRIDTLPARKTLSDGRNAHLTIQDNTLWTNLILQNVQGNIVHNFLSKKGKLDIAIEK
jgi:2-polyprenyl-3-methyl-5-hydroxy-6-metoxy-1,4-benzoquinol methylase